MVTLYGDDHGDNHHLYTLRSFIKHKEPIIISYKTVSIVKFFTKSNYAENRTSPCYPEGNLIPD